MPSINEMINYANYMTNLKEKENADSPASAMQSLVTGMNTALSPSYQLEQAKKQRFARA